MTRTSQKKISGPTVHQDHRNLYSRRGTRLMGQEPSGQESAAGAVDGPVVHSGSEKTPAVALNGTKAQFVVNGCVNRGSDGTGESRTSAVTDAAADGDAPLGISVRGRSGPDTRAMACSSEQVTPEQGLTPARKSKRRRQKARHKKRDTQGTCPGKNEVLLPPQEENWENEIQGPEDVLQFELPDLTLQQRDTSDLPVAADYSPAARHPRPVRWLCRSVPTEPDQFADAEE